MVTLEHCSNLTLATRRESPRAVLAAEAIHAILAHLSAHLCRQRWVWAFKVDNSTAAKGDAQVQETWRPIDGTLETDNALVRKRNLLAANR
jgi:hypothetical protein